MKKILFTNLALVVLLSLSVSAQDIHRWTFQAGGGFSPLVGDIGSRLDNGWNVSVGGGMNFTSHFSATLNYMYNGFGVSQNVLSEAQVPDGNAHVWSLTVNPKLWLNRFGKIRPYITGGVGYYRRTVQFTQPTVAPVTIFDPFFGIFYNTLVPADQVLGTLSDSGPGGSLGGGFDVPLGDSGFKLFTEARYHYADTGNIPLRMVPLTVGIRW